MAAVTGAVIAAGTAAYSANQASSAAEGTANAANAATALQRQMYEQSRADLAPYTQEGQRSIALLGRLNQGDYSSFTESPDYVYTRDQGIKGLDRSAAARGTQYSGGQLAALADYSGGVANQAYGDYYNRIYDLAGMGQNAVATTTGAGSNYANQAGQNMMTAAGAKADAQLSNASAYSNAFGQLVGAGVGWYEEKYPKPVK